MDPAQERVFGAQSPPTSDGGGRDDFQIDLARLMRAARRQIPIVALCAFVGVVIAVLAIIGSVARYTAVETVLLDEERADLLNQVSPLPSAVLSDSSIQSEVEIIKSQALAYDVVDRLDLDTDEDFLNPPSGPTQDLIRQVMSLTDPVADLLSPPEPARPEPSGEAADDEGGGDAADRIDLAMTPRDRAASILRANLRVSRVRRSFVIEIGYRGFNPVRSAEIARAYGLSYERFQLEVAGQVAGNAADWLQERLETLEQQSIDAAAEVQRFRAENDLVEVRGDLLTEQQQSEIASELVASAADTAGARARLDSMQSLLDRAESGEPILAVPQVGDESNAVVEDLRREYLDASLRYNRLVERFGEDHPQAVELEESIEELQSVLRNELEQATETARIAYEVARSREESLRDDLQAATDTSESNLAVRGRLRQLESIADTYSSIYRDFLERFEVASQQQGFPIGSVKVISPAEVPDGASSPQKKSTLLAGFFLGGLIGVMIAAAKELRPKPLRSASEVRRQLDVDCAGLVPTGSSTAATHTMQRTIDRLARTCQVSRRGSDGLLVSLVPLVRQDDGGAEGDLPVHLAERLAQDGAKVLLIDGSDAELSEAGQGGRETYARAGMDSLRGRYIGRKETDGEPVGDETIAADLREAFDVVLVQSKPLSGAVGHRLLTSVYDLAILRIPWGKVRPSFAAEALADHPTLRARLATTVLEGAKLRTARRYMTPGSYEERETYA